MRVTNWREALLEVVEAAHGRRFRWGQHDCCQFAARCVEAVCGYQARLLFPTYQTKAEAFEILESVGGMLALVTRALGEPQPVAFAGEGDIVLTDMGQGPQPALCRGLICQAPGRRTLMTRKTLDASAAWIL